MRDKYLVILSHKWSSNRCIQVHGIPWKRNQYNQYDFYAAVEYCDKCINENPELSDLLGVVLYQHGEPVNINLHPPQIGKYDHRDIIRESLWTLLTILLFVIVIAAGLFYVVFPLNCMFDGCLLTRIEGMYGTEYHLGDIYYDNLDDAIIPSIVEHAVITFFVGIPIIVGCSFGIRSLIRALIDLWHRYIQAEIRSSKYRRFRFIGHTI